MSCTVRALFAGSSESSQPRGLPVSTAQKRQARVQTAPISMRVAVPAFQHSPMFGHFASSQTVARRCSRTVARTASNALPAGIGARSQLRLAADGQRLRRGRGLDAVLDRGEALRGPVLVAAARLRLGRRHDGNAFEIAHGRYSNSRRRGAEKSEARHSAGLRVRWDAPARRASGLQTCGSPTSRPGRATSTRAFTALNAWRAASFWPFAGRRCRG